MLRLQSRRKFGFCAYSWILFSEWVLLKVFGLRGETTFLCFYQIPTHYPEPWTCGWNELTFHRVRPLPRLHPFITRSKHHHTNVSRQNRFRQGTKMDHNTQTTNSSYTHAFKHSSIHAYRHTDIQSYTYSHTDMMHCQHNRSCPCMSAHAAQIDLPSWPANWTALASTTCQQHSAAPVDSTTDRHHWPGPLAACSKHVDDDDNTAEAQIHAQIMLRTVYKCSSQCRC